jgi:transglutaminase-like putative cysteine protease
MKIKNWKLKIESMSIKHYLSFAILAFLFLFLPRTIYAAANFTTDYNVTYTVSETGITHAKLQGTLTNTSSQYYASSYKMQLGFDNIENVKASDPDGAISAKVDKNDDGYAIGLNFNTKSVGMGSKLPFTITFDTPTIAQRFGHVWEINIPGIANPDDFTAFTVNVIVPKSFGKTSYIKPAQPRENLTFSKEQLGKSGISVAFGDQQLYSFSLKYHLRNDNVYPIHTEIALPPSTNYQETFITQMSPPPIDVTEDADGNWLAEYRLLPTEKKDIEVTGVSAISLIPKEQALTQTEFAEYLKEQPYWETSKVEIKKLAKELKTPRAIYDYVVGTLNYDFSRVTEDKPRLGALGSLKNPGSAVCLEFTDLFVALARAAGIPAREVDGFAYTENSKQRPLSLVTDILHAWPEYYDNDRKTWIMVDPTWGSTTGGVDYFNVLDFDHFAFVIKGTDSKYPIPAGGYKFLDSKGTKDVNVHFADSLPNQTDAEVSSNFPEVSIAGLPISGKITIKNTGTAKIKPQTFFVDSEILLPNEQIVITEGIPPFGQQTWNLKFKPTDFLTNTYAPFTIRFAADSDLEGKNIEQNIKIAPFFLTLWGIGGITFGILIIILFVVALRFRRLRFLK